MVGGRYDESHAHQDQGAFNLFGGDWLAVTENIWTHSGIEQGVEMHDTLRFVSGLDTVPQSPDTTSTMTVSEIAGTVHVVVDGAPAYAPSGLVDSWTRTLDLDATGLTVHDVYTVEAGVEARFQLQTPALPVVNGNEVTAGDLRVEALSPASPGFTILDWSTIDSDEFLSGYRLEIGGGTGGYLVRLERVSLLFADGFESGGASSWSVP